jgi:hypothetical protein
VLHIIFLWDNSSQWSCKKKQLNIGNMVVKAILIVQSREKKASRAKKNYMEIQSIFSLSIFFISIYSPYLDFSCNQNNLNDETNLIISIFSILMAPFDIEIVKINCIHQKVI